MDALIIMVVVKDRHTGIMTINNRKERISRMGPEEHHFETAELVDPTERQIAVDMQTRIKIPSSSQTRW